MALSNELCALADRHTEASEEARLALKMAISLLDQLHDPHSTRPRKVKFTYIGYQRVPGRWELVEGQLVSRSLWTGIKIQAIPRGDIPGRERYDPSFEW